MADAIEVKCYMADAIEVKCYMADAIEVKSYKGYIIEVCYRSYYWGYYNTKLTQHVLHISELYNGARRETGCVKTHSSHQSLFLYELKKISSLSLNYQCNPFHTTMHHVMHVKGVVCISVCAIYIVTFCAIFLVCIKCVWVLSLFMSLFKCLWCVTLLIGNIFFQILVFKPYYYYYYYY